MRSSSRLSRRRKAPEDWRTPGRKRASVYYVAQAFQSRVFHDKLATGKSPEPADRNVCATWKMETLQGESWRVRCSARSGSAAAVAGESLQAPKARVPDKCETVSHFCPRNWGRPGGMA